MIISEDHILQAELNNLTLAHAYYLPTHTHCTSSLKTKKVLTHSRDYLLSQWTPHTETNILLIIPPFSDMDKQLSHHTQKLAHCCQRHHTLHHLAIHTFISLPNPAVFITTLFTQRKHLAPHSKTPSTTTHTHPHTPIRTYPQWYTHGDITAVVIPISSSIAYTPNSSWCHGQWTMNRTSRHPIKILISSNVYEAHQRRRPHAVNSESSVMHC